MQFEKGAALYSTDVQREGGEDILYINYLGAPFVPSISDSPDIMSRTVDALIENPNASRIVFVQQKNYNYDFQETSYLLEIAQLYVYLMKQEKILSQEKLSANNPQSFTRRYNEIFSFLFFLKQDPLAAHSELKKIIIQTKISINKTDPEFQLEQQGFLNILQKLFTLLEQTKIIQGLLPHIESYQKGAREIYHKFLSQTSYQILHLLVLSKIFHLMQKF